MEPKVCVYRSEAIYRIRIQFQPNKLFCVSVRKPAQALQVQGDPDSPVIFNLRLGDGMVEGGAVEVLASEAHTAPLVAFSGSDDADSPV